MMTIFTFGRSDSVKTETAETIGKLCESDIFSDVIVHCRGNTRFRSSKMILSQFSKFLEDTLDLNPYADIANLICPDFDPEPMSEILSLIHKGQTFVRSAEVYRSMKQIMETLEISINLTEFSTGEKTFTPDGHESSGIAMQMSPSSSGGATKRTAWRPVDYLSDPRKVPLVNDRNDKKTCGFCDKTFASAELASKHVLSCVPGISFEDVFGKRGPAVCNVRAWKNKKRSPPDERSRKTKVRREQETEFESDEKHDDDDDDDVAAVKPVDNTDHDSDKTKFICGICDRRFAYSFSLKKHLNAKHKGEHPNDEVEDSDGGVNGSGNRKSNPAENVNFESMSGSDDSFDVDPLALDQIFEMDSAAPVAAGAGCNLQERSYTMKELVEPLVDDGTGKLVYECKFCSAKSSSKGNLRIHISVAHFKSEILEVNGNDEKKCNSCDKSSNNVHALIYHIGIGHKVLEKILANEDPNETFMTTNITRGRKIGQI